MNPEQEPINENLEEGKQERIRKIVELFEIGLDSEDCIGYHGTSLEAVEFLLENGHLPGGKFDSGVDNPQENYLYFFPKKSEFLDHPLASEFHEQNNVIQETAGYAGDIAERHFVLRELGLDVSDSELEANAAGLFTAYSTELENIYNSFEKLGIDKERLGDVKKAAEKRKGVILALRKSVLSSYNISEGDRGEGDLRILIPQGLSIDLLSGLEPMGDQEFNFFEELKKSNNL